MGATETPKSEVEEMTTDEPKTQWIGLTISSLLSFLCGAQITLYYNTMWPFLLQLDPETTETFYGFTNAAHSLAQAIMAIFSGFLINKLEKSRLVIVIGFSSMAVANCLYLLCSIQLFPADVVMVFMRVFLGTGAATYTILRTYSVQVSTFSDRSRAISMGLAAFSLGLSAGHSVQALFASFGYPGTNLILGFYLSRYTAPAFTGLLSNLVAILISILLFREADIPDGLDLKRQKKTDDETVSLPPYDKIAVAICIFTQFAYMVMLTTVETVHAPYVMTMFNWTKKEAQYYSAIRLAASGYIALGFYCGDLIFGLWNRLNQRIGAIIGVLLLFAFNVLTFSWWWLPGTLAYQVEFIVVNGSQVLNPEPLGCRRSFEWCKDVPPVNVWLFNISYPLLVGTGIAFSNSNMNTIFSKVIGPRKQGFLMGLLVGIGCLAKTVGPLSLSALFRYYGPRPVWAIGMIFSGGCAALWIAFYHRLQPLKKGGQ